MSSLAVYLIRHGVAEPPSFAPDHLRGLTAEGRLHLRDTARTLAETVGQIGKLFTSPLVRAVQTAEIIAGGLSLQEVHPEPTISNPPSVQALIDLIKSTPGNLDSVGLVGHEPTMSFLAAHLLGIREFPRSFRPGTVLRLSLDRLGTDPGTFEWILQSPGPQRIDKLDA